MTFLPDGGKVQKSSSFFPDGGSILSGIGSFVNAPFEQITKQANTITKSLNRSKPVMTQVAEAAPQYAQAIGDTLGQKVFSPVGAPGEFLGTGAGKVGSNILKGVTAPFSDKSGYEKTADVLRAVGSLNPAKVMGEALLFPAVKVVGGLGKDIFDSARGVKDPINIRLPSKQELLESYKEGIDFTSLLGPLQKAAGVALKPILSKISPAEIGNINQYINLAKNAPTKEAQKKFIDLATKRIVQNLSAEFLKGGVGYGAMGALKPAQDIEERINNTLSDFLSGGAFSAGMKGASVAGQALKGQVIDRAVEGYKNMTPYERQAGFVKLGSGEMEKMSPGEKKAYELLRKGESPLKIIEKYHLSQNDIQKASERMGGLGLLTDFNTAANAGNKKEALRILQEIQKAPNDAPIASYKEGVSQRFNRFFPSGETVEVYRGSGANLPALAGERSYGPGTYYSTDKQTAEFFGPTTKQKITFKNPLILKDQADLAKSSLDMAGNGYESLADYARAKGYDGIIDRAVGTVISFSDDVKPPSSFTPLVPGGNFTPPPGAMPPGGIPPVGSPPPAQVPPKSTEKLIAGGGEYSMKRFNVPDAVDQVIRDNAKSIAKDLRYERRGVVNWDKSLKDAEAIDIAKFLSRERGTGANDAYIAAASNYISSTATRIADLKSQITNAQNLGQPTEALQNELKLQVALNQAVIQKGLGATTEAGRAMNAAKILAKQMESPQMQLKKLVEREHWENLDYVTKKLMEFDPEDKEGMMKFLMQIKPSTPIDKLDSFWTNNILSGTATQIANAVGNTTRTVWHIATKPLRVGTDVVRARVTNKPREEFMSEWGPEIVGTYEGIPNGVRKGLRAFNSGLKEADIQNLTPPNYTPLSGKMWVFGLPSRALVALDEFSRAVNQSMSTYGQAARIATKEGLKGDAFSKRVGELVANPTPKMMQESSRIATKLLFQDMGSEIEAAGRFRQIGSVNLGKLGTLRPMRFVLPFIQVAANVAKFNLESSPVGGAATLMKGPGALGASEFNRRMASAVLGSGIMAAVATMFQSGKMTGKAPRQEPARSAFFAQHPEYSVKIGNNWVPYNRLDPFSSIFGTVALFHDNFTDGKDDKRIHEKIMSFLGGYANLFVDRTFLVGLSELMDAIQDPDRYMDRFLYNRGRGFIPYSSLMKEVSDAQERFYRDPQNMEESLDVILPWQRSQVPFKENKFTPSGLAEKNYPWWQEFLPVRISKDQAAPEAQIYESEASLRRQENQIEKELERALQPR